jgi:uncharacterized protein YcfJ
MTTERSMDKSMIKGMAIGGMAMVVLTAGGVTGYQALSQAASAEVLSAKEVMEKVVTPREVCEQVEVKRQAPVQDSNRVAGTALGGLAGGLLGNQIGGGRGKTAATVVGAAAGAYAGNQVQKNMQQKDLITTTENRCKTVEETSEKLVGYDVSYRLQGKEGVVRMDHKPGKTLPVKDGQLVLDAPPPSN